MAILSYDTMTPRIHPRAWVHDSVELLGDVEVGEDVTLWPTAVLRGDSGFVKIGARTNLQDATVCHATSGLSNVTVGQEVTVGHRVTLHGCTVGDHCLVGMGSIILDNVRIGEWSFIGAGSLLTPGKIYEPRSFILGSPARRVREVGAKELEAIVVGARAYLELLTKYRGP